MLIAERSTTRPVRHTFGFSLTEAARIRRDLLASRAEPECPRCSAHLDVVGSRGTDDVVWIATCPDCKVSLVIHRRAGDLV